MYYKYTLYLITLYLLYNYYKNRKNLVKQQQEEEKLKEEFNNIPQLNFPANFKFGVATASHQNEGNNRNNWTLWEDIKNLEKSGECNKSWELFEEQLKYLKELKVNSFRFSLEWSRIVPKQGEIDINALNRYKSWIILLKNNNIEPLVTLHHFTRPQWVDVLYGGLHNKKFLQHWVFYVTTVAKEIAPLVTNWITFNEPILVLLNGYVKGTRPPGYKMEFNYLQDALVNICDAHCLAYDILKDFNPNSRISIAKNYCYFKNQYTADFIKYSLATKLDYMYNYAILNALTSGELSLSLNFYFYNFGTQVKKKEWENKLDFLGINHYNYATININYTDEEIIDINMGPSNQYPKNDMGWSMVPYSLYLSLKNLSHYNLPIIITENGSCDNSLDHKRKSDFLLSQLYSIVKAQNEGIIIQGYMYWTLFDNFEWDDGYFPRFGLFKTDFEKQKQEKTTDTSKYLTNTGKIYVRKQCYTCN